MFPGTGGNHAQGILLLDALLLLRLPLLLTFAKFVDELTERNHQLFALPGLWETPPPPVSLSGTP